MSSDDLMEWLGPAADDLTPEQIDRIRAESRQIDERYPDPDEQGERDAALSAVVQHLLGETTAEDAKRTLIDARAATDRAFAAALQHAVMLVHDRQLAGEKPNKLGAAQAVGVDRMSLLKALGER
jgi:hypothetical protein